MAAVHTIINDIQILRDGNQLYFNEEGTTLVPINSTNIHNISAESSYIYMEFLQNHLLHHMILLFVLIVLLH
jgi:hypothetical protein